MRHSRLPFYHHCFQISGEADWEYDSTITDQGIPCSPLLVIHDNNYGCQIRQGFWWSAGGSFSITIKLPVLLYSENSQDSLTQLCFPRCYLTLVHHLQRKLSLPDINKLFSTKLQQWQLVSGLMSFIKRSGDSKRNQWAAPMASRLTGNPIILNLIFQVKEV